MYDGTRKSQIRNLIVIIGSGVIAALFLVFGTLYFYNPPGNYYTKNVLLHPDSVKSMRFSEGSSRKSGDQRFVIDDIEFSYFDQATNKVKVVKITMDQYAKFYALVDGEESIGIIPNETENTFNQTPVATLILKVRNESDSHSQGQSKNFLVVAFLPQGDYYRIQLRTQTTQESWAYFLHPGIYQQVLTLFNQP